MAKRGEEKVKIVPVDVRIEEGKLIVEGRDLFSGLLDRSRSEETLVKQNSFVAGLPEEDLTPGHVMPPVIVTVSRSS